MTVSQTITGDWVLLSGTAAEVTAALETYKVPEHKLKAAFYNGTNVSVIYHK